MPKPKYQITKTLLDGLKWKLEETIFYKISSKTDCKNLSFLIKEKTGKTVSESTIYRLFLWDANQNAPYKHTLDILAEFTGKNDWAELENEISNLHEFKLLFGSNQYNRRPFDSLLTINIHQRNYDALSIFFDQFDSSLSLEKKMTLGEEIFHSLKTNKISKNKIFFKRFCSKPIVRESFFELLADPDFTISDYEDGMKFYLNEINSIISPTSFQDFIFGNALLFRYYFILDRKADSLKIGQELYSKKSFTTEKLNQIYVFPKYRYLAYRLMYNYLKGKPDKNYWDWLFEYSKEEIRNTSSFIKQRIIIHTILDALQFDSVFQEKVFDEFYFLFPKVFSLYPKNIKKKSMSERLYLLNANASKFMI
jgi:hypothetical protein